MYNFSQVKDSFNTFFQVFLNGMVVAQFENVESCHEYISSKTKGDITLDFSKTIVNTSVKFDVELCTSIKDEIHFIKNPENNDCASASYELVDGTLFLTKQWDTSKSLPQVVSTVKELKKLIKLF